MDIKYGDIIQLGDHRLAFGDATDKALVKKLIGNEKVSLILVDVPYGIAAVESKPDYAQFQKNKIIINDHLQTDEEYKTFTTSWLDAIKPYLTSKNTAYVFNSDKMIFALRQGMIEAGFTFSQLLVWIKNHSTMGRLNYLSQSEFIAYGWFGAHTFMKSQDKSVLFYPRPTKSPLHPSMKPVGLLRRLILNSSRIGDVVYDGFAGSGSSGIACEQTRRRCFMIELDIEYCQTIITRLEKLAGIKAQKI